ncbi:hypothetical protein JW905_17715 [bacterium]|nr:hypothetical protein [candidate division CSSED10-310 bacterium]
MENNGTVEKLEKKVNLRRLLVGLLLLVVSTYISAKYFHSYSISLTFQVFWVFICVAGFVSGIILTFSAIQRKSWWNYIITPLVVIMGVIFVMNYLYYSGVVQIINEYPELRAEYSKNRATMADMVARLTVLETENRMMSAMMHLQNAELLVKRDGKFNEAALELQQVRELLKGTEFKEMEALNSLISDLEKVPSDLHTRIVWLTIDIQKALGEK